MVCPFRKKEVDALSMFSNGRSIAWVAGELGISRNTIVTWCTRMRATVGASNMTQLIAIALRRRWIE